MSCEVSAWRKISRKACSSDSSGLLCFASSQGVLAPLGCLSATTSSAAFSFGSSTSLNHSCPRSALFHKMSLFPFPSLQGAKPALRKMRAATIPFKSPKNAPKWKRSMCRFWTLKPTILSSGSCMGSTKERCAEMCSKSRIASFCFVHFLSAHSLRWSLYPRWCESIASFLRHASRHVLIFCIAGSRQPPNATFATAVVLLGLFIVVSRASDGERVFFASSSTT
mmetsp:Transcript_9133/g.18221  ORF Transcript_9133/g.18221 Transcript_9133/m.18221 type:complete len:224 (+) Transcript_9133:106-777(+)